MHHRTQQAVPPVPIPVAGSKTSQKARRPIIWTALLALTLLAASCSDDGDLVDSGIAAGDQSTTSADDGSTVDSEDPDDQTDVDGSDDTADGSDDDDDTVVDDVAIVGLCSPENTNSEEFYAVTNIAEDDPDGGLNVRDNYEGGEVLGTLPPGSVVFVEDCYQLADGSAWYGVSTADDVNGWVNSAFLTPNIPSSEPSFGGEETAAKVELVLDAIAAKRWDVAAEELNLSDREYLPLASLLGEPGPAAEPAEGEEVAGPDLAALLQEYCTVRICDAPYTIIDIRGSYVPGRVSPEVDVNFTYSGGIVTETFGQLQGDGDEFTLNTLPGQSILAFNRTVPTVGELVTDAESAQSGLLEAAEAVRRGLLSESGPGISDDYMPSEGVVLSSNAFIAEQESERQIVTASDLVASGNNDRLWGYTDGVGRPIIQSVEEWMASYRRNIALLEPDTIGINERVGLGNTIDNLAAAFPNATTVEFHRAGRGELSDFNWSSVRIALELRDREWKVVAITLDNWTI